MSCTREPAEAAVALRLRQDATREEATKAARKQAPARPQRDPQETGRRRLTVSVLADAAHRAPPLASAGQLARGMDVTHVLCDGTDEHMEAVKRLRTRRSSSRDAAGRVDEDAPCSVVDGGMRHLTLFEHPRRPTTLIDAGSTSMA